MKMPILIIFVSILSFGGIISADRVQNDEEFRTTGDLIPNVLPPNVPRFPSGNFRDVSTLQEADLPGKGFSSASITDVGKRISSSNMSANSPTRVQVSMDEDLSVVLTLSKKSAELAGRRLISGVVEGYESGYVTISDYGTHEICHITVPGIGIFRMDSYGKNKYLIRRLN